MILKTKSADDERHAELQTLPELRMFYKSLLPQLQPVQHGAAISRVITTLVQFEILKDNSKCRLLSDANMVLLESHNKSLSRQRNQNADIN